MKDGNIVQIGHPSDIYHSPANQFVADFIGSTNFLSGSVYAVSADSKIGKVETAYGVFDCNIPAELRRGGTALISVRPENIQLTALKPEGTNNVMEGQVQVAIFLGEMYDCQVAVKDQIMRVRLHPSQRVHRGDQVFLHLPTDSITVMPGG
jgi:iron(III) transport system ATP-binding protein